MNCRSRTYYHGKQRVARKHGMLSMSNNLAHRSSLMSSSLFAMNLAVGFISLESPRSRPQSLSCTITALGHPISNSHHSILVGTCLSTQNTIQLALDQPEHFIRYSGVLELNAINSLLVARNLALTSTHRLTSKSRRLLIPVRDELFIFQ